MKFQRIFFTSSNAPLVRTLKWLMPADWAPFELHAGAQAGQGTTKPVTGQAGVTFGFAFAFALGSMARRLDKSLHVSIRLI